MDTVVHRRKNMIIKHILDFLVLLSGGMLSSAQETVIAEGDDIRLDCSEIFQQKMRLRWFAGGHSSPPSYSILIYSELTPGSGTWVTRKSPGTKYHDRIDHSTESVCIIRPSQKDDDTQYYCEKDAEPDAVKRTFTYRIIARPTQPPTVTPGPAARSQRGTPMQLICQLQEDTGEPINYTWSRSNGEVRGQVDHTRGTLTFTSTVAGDQDTYTCRASNRAGHTEASVQLFVDFHPTTFGITTYNSGDILYSGDNKEMICRTDGGRPLPTLSWNCVRQTGTHGGTGNIRTISFTAEVQPNWHNQNCVCTATQEIPAMTQATSVTFIVYYPPTSPSLTLVDSPWLEDTVSSSQCHVTTGNPAVSTFKWYKGQVSAPIVSGTAEQVHQLQYTFTKDVHGVGLACTVENQHTTDKEGTPARAEVTVNVEYHPRVTLTPDAAIIVRKENVALTLTCTADSNPAAVNNDFQWTKDESPLPLGPEILIPIVKKTDSGQYKCTVTVQRANNKGELSGHAQTTVDIQYFHVTGSRHQEVTENDNLVLNCTVDSNPSSFTFNKWTHIRGGRDTELSSTRIEGNVAYLDLSPVNYTAGGTYRCEAGNDVYPKITEQQNVTVFYSPKSDTHAAAGEITYAALGTSVSFGMVVHAYPPDITFTWRALINGSGWEDLSQGDKYVITDTVTSSSLVVRNVSVTDYTQYVLNATNNVRNGASFSFILMPRGAPWPPSFDASRSFSTAVSVEVWWRSHFDGGYTQTFSVYYREVGGEFILFRGEIRDQGLYSLHNIRVTPLKPGTAYEFKVEAHNEHEGGSTATSSIIQISTLERPQRKNTSLIIQRHGSRAYLTWERPGGVYDTQRIEQHDTTGQRQRRSTGTCTPPTCQASENLSVDTTSYNVTGLVQGRTYQFVLVLFYKGDEVQRQRFNESVRITPHSPNEVNTGAIIGGVIGGLLVTVMISVLVLVYFRKRKQGNKETAMGKMPEGENTKEIRSPEQAYELLNKPTEYENVKKTSSDEDKNYQELQKPTHYENVERKKTSQEQTYEELSRPTNAATNGKTPQASASIDEGGATYEKLQYNN